MTKCGLILLNIYNRKLQLSLCNVLGFSAWIFSLLFLLSEDITEMENFLITCIWGGGRPFWKVFQTETIYFDCANKLLCHKVRTYFSLLCLYWVLLIYKSVVLRMTWCWFAFCKHLSFLQCILVLCHFHFSNSFLSDDMMLLKKLNSFFWTAEGLFSNSTMWSARIQCSISFCFFFTYFICHRYVNYIFYHLSSVQPSRLLDLIMLDLTLILKTEQSNS